MTARRSPVAARVAVAAIVAGGGLALGGCTVGSGSGAAAGPLWVSGCTDGNPYGTPSMPVSYNLNPTFFAADPVEDQSQAVNLNQLVIRMQRTGQAIEYNDALYFSINNSYEVARCVRGHVDDMGNPDWDTVGLNLGPWCDWTGALLTDGWKADGGAPDGGAGGGAPDGGGGDGGVAVDGGAPGNQPTPGLPIIHITSQGYLQSSLQLLATCPLNVETGMGTAVVGHSFDGWLQFLDFGSAAQSDLPADQRTTVPTGFKVNYGERLRAKFHVELTDDRVLTAIQTDPTGPIMAPLIGGTLDGNFDFDLVRGRAAQPFP